MANSFPSQGSACSPRRRGSESILFLSRDPHLPCVFHTTQRSPPRAKITWQPHGTGCPATSSFDSLKSLDWTFADWKLRSSSHRELDAYDSCEKAMALGFHGLNQTVLCVCSTREASCSPPQPHHQSLGSPSFVHMRQETPLRPSICT